MKSYRFVFFGLIILCAACSNAGGTSIRSETDRINYSVGYQIGGDFKSQGVQLNPDVLVKGISDAQYKRAPLITETEMNKTLVDLKRKIIVDQKANAEKANTEQRRADAGFLAENAKMKDVKVLPSGVQYKVLKPGSGKKPTLKDSVKVHYSISRIDGHEISNTYGGDKPRTILLSKALPGLREVLLLMNEGSKYRIFLPTATAAGGHEPLDDIGVLIYEVELISVFPGQGNTGPAMDNEPKQQK